MWLPPGNSSHGQGMSCFRATPNNLWCRRDVNRPWCLDVTISDGDSDFWIYRRDPHIRIPWANVVLRQRTMFRTHTGTATPLQKQDRRKKDDVAKTARYNDPVPDQRFDHNRTNCGKVCLGLLLRFNYSGEYVQYLRFLAGHIAADRHGRRTGRKLLDVGRLFGFLLSCIIRGRCVGRRY